MFRLNLLQKGLSLASFLLRKYNHSSPKTVNLESMDVHVLSALTDNYMYLIVDKNSQNAAIVDPVNPSKVLELVKSAKVNLTTVLTTHHHWDHAGGNKQIAKDLPDLKIVGGDSRIDAITQVVKHGDKFTLGDLEIECLSTPCHTSGHICYKVSAQNDISLFTGDTLFIAGCGKFFEGTADQMYNALVKIIGTLPDDTKIYCGHEYTISNLKYAKHVEPNNADIERKIAFAKTCKEGGTPTVPSTIGDEKLYNPFMRVEQLPVQEHAKQVGDPVKTMEALRNEKNQF